MHFPQKNKITTNKTHLKQKKGENLAESLPIQGRVCYDYKKVTDSNSRPAISLPMAGRFLDFQNCVKQRRDWMRKRILRIAMAVLMLAVMVPSALAAT